MEKDVAVDAHGNPLPDEDQVSVNGDVALEGGDFSERQRLTADVDDIAEEEARSDDEEGDSHRQVRRS